MMENFLSNNLKYLKLNSLWVKASTIVFFGSALFFGGIASLYPQLVENIFYGYFTEIEQIGEQVFGADPLIGTVMLFWNNLMASLIMILFGIILSLPTLFALSINGGALGVLASFMSFQGINPIPVYILGILPHGIFEIPAILISGGLGLKIGYQLLFPPSSANRLAALKTNINHGIKLLPGIVILLAVAAVIEIFVTPQLLDLAGLNMEHN
ncbi:stage II sporulation protein M [Natranaerobius thermophilus]|uniref:Stage II sporulation protein M n=1 Tax=Natranaerobius thermophilus (strain ATCC BAA-1301 / DSM 18059 / JW/NM-WN-LF) TaxID=457570 RepID=B2A0Q3_NATTJ|nr:stage II sporulation protein M [Natranaerobius thermophilus]ACB85933.1 protein of unknown function DUF95 transmembrane [Natranaerobius thermophilus JW/NM-WN-LF]